MIFVGGDVPLISVGGLKNCVFFMFFFFAQTGGTGTPAKPRMEVRPNAMEASTYCRCLVGGRFRCGPGGVEAGHEVVVVSGVRTRVGCRAVVCCRGCGGWVLVRKTCLCVAVTDASVGVDVVRGGRCSLWVAGSPPGCGTGVVGGASGCSVGAHCSCCLGPRRLCAASPVTFSPSSIVFARRPLSTFPLGGWVPVGPLLLLLSYLLMVLSFRGRSSGCSRLTARGVFTRRPLGLVRMGTVVGLGQGGCFQTTSSHLCAT